MTKNVTVRIEGTQRGEAGDWEEPVIVNAIGSYRVRNGSHYIFYEEETEASEGAGGLTKARIKISADRIEMTGKGAAASQMVLDINNSTEAVYETPYGKLRFEVRTTKMALQESAGKLEVTLEYTLYFNGTHLSDNRTCIELLGLSRPII